MAIRVVPDLGAPIIVFGIDQIVKKTMPEFGEWVVYAETLAGYLGAWAGWGGDLLKNIGVASLPASLNLLTERIGLSGSVRKTSKLSLRRTVSRYPGPAQETPFGTVKLT